MFPAETVDGLVHQMGGLRLRAECSLVPPRPREPTSAAAEDGDGAGARCPVGTAVATSPGGAELRRHYDRIVHTVPPFYDHPPPPPPRDETGGPGRAASGVVARRDDASSSDDDPRARRSRELLRACYRRSFDVAFGTMRDDDGGARSEEGTGPSLRRALEWCGLGARPPSARPTFAPPINGRVAVPLLGAGCRAFPRDVALDVAASEGASWLLSKPKREEAARESKARGGDDDADSGGEMSVVFGLLEEADAEALSERLERLLMTDVA